MQSHAKPWPYGRNSLAFRCFISNTLSSINIHCLRRCLPTACSFGLTQKNQKVKGCHFSTTHYGAFTKPRKLVASRRRTARALSAMRTRSLSLQVPVSK